MDQLKPPGELCLEGNLAENWRKWIQSFDLFLIASGISEKSEKGSVCDVSTCGWRRRSCRIQFI